MKNKILTTCVFALAVCNVQNLSAAGELSVAARQLVRSAVVEVVIEKDDPKDKLVYEKELDWEVVPYQIRSDKDYSIGTAFAISQTELITAFHVINLGSKSQVYKNYYVRDSAGKVFEVDNVTGGDNERDFLIFTIKDHTPFTNYFNFDTSYEVDDAVYSIGNALGEGIVIRSGSILGTVPEPENGRWDQLKSSADVNPGNSGGPLVTPEGNVAGLVIAMRDNILYSTPASVITEYQRKTLHYRIKSRYGHLILENNITRVFEHDVDVPSGYKEAQDKITEAYKPEYVKTMTKLFEEAPAYLDGPNNAYLFLLQSSMSGTFPQIDFVDQNDDNWKLTNFNTKQINLDDDGRLTYTSLSDYNFFKIKRPKTVPLEKLDTNPKFIMDLILQNWRINRTLYGNNKYRILSFGEPVSTEKYLDGAGRLWIKSCWLIEYADEVLLVYILPLPSGPVVITSIQSSDEQFVYEWDMQKICDHIHSAYSGSFEEWNMFSKLGAYIPNFLRDVKYNLTSKKNISLSIPALSINENSDSFEWSSESELYMLPSYYKIDDKVKFGISKIILYKDSRGRDFVMLNQSTKPDPKLGTDYRIAWEDLMAEKFPFNGRPTLSPKDNNGVIGAALYPKNEKTPVQLRWTLYMALQDPTEADLLSRFESFKAGITLSEPKN
jgi:hypothetical protein